jgi:hypothetical protein
VVHGPIGSGKTFLAGTMSQYHTSYPEKKWTHYKDMLWIPFDSGATDGFQHNNVDIDCVPVDDILAGKEPMPGFDARHGSIVSFLSALNKVLYKLVQDSGYKTLVVDTVSTLNDDTVTYLDGQTDDTWTLYRRNLAINKKFSMALRATGVTIIYLCHSTAPNKEATDKNKEVLMAGATEFVPDVPGKAAGHLKRHASVQIFVTRIVDPKTRESTRFIELASKKGEGKNRFEGLLPAKSPPNLRPLIAKIEESKKRKRT